MVDAAVVRATPHRAATPRVSGSALPNTGADLGTPVTIGFVLLIAGGALLVTSRRRRIAARN